MSSIYTKEYVRGQTTTDDTTNQQLNARRQKLDSQIEAEDNVARKKRISNIVLWVVIVVIVIIGIIIAWILLTRPATAPGGSTGQTTTGTALGGACTDNSTCAVGLICSANKCKNVPQASCTASSDCPDKYSCVGGKCLGNGQSLCGINNDCQAPLVCNNQTCVSQSCTNQTACDAAHGGQCTNTKCVGLLGNYCAVDGDCAQPYHCDTTTNQCAVQTCLSNFNCTNTTGPNQVLCGIGNPQTCVLGPNVACLESQQCESDPLDSPPGFMGTQTCDPIDKKCHAFSGNLCNVNDAITTAACLAGDTCVPIVGSPPLGICSCAKSSDCVPNKPVCDLNAGPNQNTCVGCLADSDCKTAPRTKCNTTALTCVPPCTTNADCAAFSPYLTCGPSHYCVV